MEKLIYDKPKTKGAENVLKRARQLAELRWTPVKPFPVIASDALTGGKAYLFLPAWRPRRGVNYSGTRYDEKYVGTNVSIYTFMTAMSNPDGVLYTRNLFGRSVFSAAIYGTVCSQYASYAFDLPFHIDCGQWPSLPGVREVPKDDLDKLELCDVINDTLRHTAIVTGLGRTEKGEVREIILSEATTPAVRVTTFTPVEFRHYWLERCDYHILRFDEKALSRVSYTPEPFCPFEGDPETPAPFINPDVMPDYGDRANYTLGTEVAFFVPDGGFTEVAVFKGETEIKAIPCAGSRASFTPPSPGYYTAAARGEKGISQKVSFCVTDAKISLDKAVYRQGEKIRPACSCAADDEFKGWLLRTREFMKVWGYPAEDGKAISAEAPKPGRYTASALYKNAYGTYISTPAYFDVTE